MDREQGISRRRFLTSLAALVGGSALAGSGLIGTRNTGAAGEGRGPHAPTITSYTYLPLAVCDSACAPRSGKVVHVHDGSATHWSGQSNYWDYVDQGTVSAMVERGLRELTGAPTAAAAWQALIPNYQPGQKVAIKVNFNNTRTCDSVAPNIDALIQPVNAVAEGLIQMGVAPADIGVYDAIRALPDRFVAGALPGLSFFDGSWVICTTEAGFSFQPESRVTFYPPPDVSVPDVYVTNVLMNASYLINMPIMKGTHPLASVTLGFKNHFGTINSPQSVHTWVDVVHEPPGYRTDYNVLVDLMRSPLIGGKTVLTIGDGLFAARIYNQAPVPWTSFGDQVPNSLFFATDPVAVDCVMHDLLVTELGTGVRDGANNYLRLAAEAGLGVFEQGDPWAWPYGSGYQQIQYVRVDGA